jgi:hypothetical protein
MGALLDEGARHGKADSLACSRDDRDAALKSEIHPLASRASGPVSSFGKGCAMVALSVVRRLALRSRRDVARVLVVFLRRTGNQAQFSAQLETQVADRQPVRELQLG